MPSQVLTFGQAYQISLQLEMPDSQANQALGMFMIKTSFFSQDGGQVASSALSVSCAKICSPPFFFCLHVQLRSNNTPSSVDLLLHCYVFLRQDKSCPRPAPALWVLTHMNSESSHSLVWARLALLMLIVELYCNRKWCQSSGDSDHTDRKCDK